MRFCGAHGGGRLCIALSCFVWSVMGDMDTCGNESAEYTGRVVAWSKRVTAKSANVEYWISSFADMESARGAAEDNNSDNCEADLLAFSVVLQLRPRISWYLGDLQGTAESSSQRSVVAAFRSAAQLIGSETAVLDIGDVSDARGVLKDDIVDHWRNVLGDLQDKMLSSAPVDLLILEKSVTDAPWLGNLLDALTECCLTIRSMIMTVGVQPRLVCTNSWMTFRGTRKSNFEVVTIPGCGSQISFLRLESQPKRILRGSDWPSVERLATFQVVSSRYVGLLVSNTREQARSDQPATTHAFAAHSQVRSRTRAARRHADAPVQQSRPRLPAFPEAPRQQPCVPVHLPPRRRGLGWLRGGGSAILVGGMSHSQPALRRTS